MSLEEVVHDLYKKNSNYLYDEQAANLAASLQVLSDDLYSDPLRFLYELIQNADDAGSKHLRFTLVSNEYLMVTHDGRGFEKQDLYSLCSVGQSTKTRSIKMSGYKGLGFKSVFGKSNYVLIMSNGDCFGFDAKFDFRPNKNNNGSNFKCPWQICPIWTKYQDIPLTIRNWLNDDLDEMPVKIMIQLADISETRDALVTLSREPRIFIFTRQICQLEFRGISNEPKIQLERKDNQVVNLIDDKGGRTQWLVYRGGIVVPEHILKDSRLPEKMRQNRHTEIGFAAKLKSLHKRTIDSLTDNNSVLYAYIPTKITMYNLPLLVNANFLTNANREQIHDDSIWNKWLFERIPHETIKWVKKLTAINEWRSTAYDLLPKVIGGLDTLATAYNDGYREALSSIDFIRNKSGDCIKINEAISDKTTLTELSWIDPQSIREYILKNWTVGESLSTHPFVNFHPRLEELGVRVFVWDHAIEMFNSIDFQSKFSISQNLALIDFLFERKENKEIDAILYKLPFIMDRQQRLKNPREVYLPSKSDNKEWDLPDCPDSYVHRELIKDLPINHRKWLEKLGMTTKTDLTYFHRTIIPNAATIVTLTNALELIQQLFSHFINGDIKTTELEKLKELSLLTEAKTLVPARRLYLASDYQPSFDAQAVLPDHPELFVSVQYRSDCLSSEWQRFFLAMGVKENIATTKFSNVGRLWNDYCRAQERIIYNLGSHPVHEYLNSRTIELLEYTENNFGFARSFWNHVIKHLDINVLSQPSIACWGRTNGRYAGHRSEVNNYLQWFVRERPCIPVVVRSTEGEILRECRRSSEICFGQLTLLVGLYLPTVQLFLDESFFNESWIKFFRFKTELMIDDHLFILHQIYLRNHPIIIKEDYQRIQNIYGNLLEALDKIRTDKLEEYRVKAMKMPLRLLCADEHGFLPPEKLNYWSIDCLPPPSSLKLLEFQTIYRRHDNLHNLLHLLNVQPIQMKDLIFNPINPTICNELTTRLQSGHLRKLIDYHKLNRSKFPQFDAMHYFEADRLDFYSHHSEICAGNRQFHSTSDCLYVIKQWNSPSLLNTLIKQVCEFLRLPFKEFETHIRTLLTSPSIDDYFTELGISRRTTVLIEKNVSDANNRSSEKSDTPKTKLTEQVKPKMETSNSPTEPLQVEFETQVSAKKRFIYYYTHLENALSIVQFGIIGHNTNDRFARFSFYPKTVFQKYTENLGSIMDEKKYERIQIHPSPILIRIDLQAILDITELRCHVSFIDPSNDNNNYVKVSSEFDFTSIYADGGTESSEKASQWEFCIEEELNLCLVPRQTIMFLFQTKDAQQTFETIIGASATLTYPCSVDKAYFFCRNNTIFVNHDPNQDYISVHIDDRKEDVVEGLLVVQIQINESKTRTDIACKGNVRSVVHHEEITTIYGEDPIKVLVDQKPYSVYYKEEERIWLIYSNHPNQNFNTQHAKRHEFYIP